ncbi:hypothetical protein CF15_07160 [Pyrodictium occultum]|uniref:Uncharacterized protein n=1 Tax=Pyrodictium occultum TaxID=2309 RepID=A0A0V8RWQ5_PYROC|nr:hypothetical protein [Pyrodictium occultum]KSW12492.1 hypothetical protein CF15_07160 [Pyrodictium occultum]
MLVLPCDRGAALAKLERLHRRLRGRLLGVLASSTLAALLVLAAVTLLPLPGLALVALAILALLLAATPLLAYARLLRPLLLVERLRRGLADGSIDISEVCGRPLLEPPSR